MIRLLVVMLGVTLCGCTVTSPPNNPCGDVSCGTGRCVVDQGVAACLCDEGFRADGLSCVKRVVDVCASISCDAIIGSSCVLRADRASCQCPAGALVHEGSCVARNPCLPNPCTRVRRTTCEVINGGASCRCDLGYAPEGEGCSAIPLWTCNTQHSGVDEDTAEPDECPPLASVLAPMTNATRNLAPLGDHDWFRIAPYVREITWFEATSEDPNTALVIEVFDADGTRLLAADNRGLANAGVGFVSADGSAVLVRVRALGATAAGDYTASYRSLGFDDFTDREDEAARLTPNAAVQGETQFPGDVDVLWLELPAQLAVQLTFNSQTARLEVHRDGVTTRTLRDADRISITSAFPEQLLLVVKSETGALGTFSIHTAAVGPDDHATDPAFATPIASDGTWFAGATERVGDVDALTVPQVRGRTYLARWNSLSGMTVPTVTVSEINGAFIVRSANSRNELAWKAVSDARAVLSVTNGSTGNWQLAVTDLGPDDHADTAIGATPISLQTPLTGVVTVDADVDVFVITPIAGHVLRAKVTTPLTGTTLSVVITTPAGDALSEGTTASAQVTAAEPHFIHVRASGPVVTPYTLVVTDLGADDQAGTPTPLMLDTWSQGETQYVDDVDTFSFMATAGVVYRVQYEHDALSRAVRVTCNGTLVINSPLPADALLSPPTNGTCEVAVSSTVLGAFRLRVESLGPEDHPNTPPGAAAFTSVSGRIDYPRDRDVFRIDAAALQGYRVTLSPVDLASFRVQLLAANGAVLYEDNGWEFEFSRDWPEAVFVEVFAFGNHVGSYQLTLTALSPDDHRSTIADATPLALNTPGSGATNFFGDVDTFAVTGPAQRHLRANCVGFSSPCFVGVRRADGGVTTEAGAATVFFRTTAAAPTAWLDVTSANPTPYTLEVIDVGADDVGDTPSTATSLALGTTGLERALEVRGDVDAFRVTLNAGDIVVARCTPLSLSRCSVRVRSPLGVELQPSFRAAIAGAYVVEIVSDFAGTYRVTATLGADDHGDTSAAATPLTVGQVLAGHIDYETDVDFFSVAVGAGQRLNVELSTLCRIRVVTPSGGTGSVAYNESLSYLAANAGTYFVAVSECDGEYNLLAYF